MSNDPKITKTASRIIYTVELGEGDYLDVLLALEWAAHKIEDDPGIVAGRNTRFAHLRDEFRHGR